MCRDLFIPWKHAHQKLSFLYLCPMRKLCVLSDTIFIKYFGLFCLLAFSSLSWQPPIQMRGFLQESTVEVKNLSSSSKATSTDFVSLLSKLELHHFKISVIKHPEAGAPCHLSLAVCHQHAGEPNYLVWCCWEADGAEMSGDDHQ